MVSNKRNGSKSLAETWDVDEFLAEYRPPEQVVHITMRGDLLGRLHSLEEKLDTESQRDATASLADEVPTVEIAKEIQQVREQVRESMREFRVVAVGDARWSDLVAKHPPKPGTDQQVFNPDTFWPEVLSAALASPQMTPAQASKLFELLTSGQARKLIDAVFSTNQGDDALPKSSSASVLRRRSEPKPTITANEVSPDLFSSAE